MPASTVMPGNGPAGKEMIEAKLRELGADAVLMTKLLDRKTVREYAPGQSLLSTILVR